MASQEEILIDYASGIRILVLLVILFATSFLPAGIFSPVLVLAGLFALFISAGKLKTKLVNILFPLFVIFILGLASAFNHEQRHILRDIVYALTPVSLLICGYWISENYKMRTSFFRIIIIAGFIIALIHLSKFLFNPGIFGETIATIRYKANNPNPDLVTLALIITVIRGKLELKEVLPKLLPGFIIILILLLSFILTFSRTYVVILIVILASAMGLIGRISLKSLLVLLVFLAGFSLLVITTPKDDVVTFRGKIARSVREMVVKEYKSYKDININWRGHETWRALVSYKSGNMRQKIMGQGFGSVIKLGMTMTLGGTEFTEIPILHNGYAYILVKTGILGLLSYLIFYLTLLYRSRISKNCQDCEKIMYSRLLLGTTISLMLTMFVIGGMAEIHNSEFVLLTGFLLNRVGQFRN